MNYTWNDYIPEKMSFVESWLDAEAIQNTGIDDGWKDFFTYWKNDSEMVYGENFWCKVVSEKDTPFAAIAFSVFCEEFVIMEIVVAPFCRRRGYGSKLLKELLSSGKTICGQEIKRARAVIFPDNVGSQKAFENAGFSFFCASEDGDAWDYQYGFPKEP